MMSRLELARQYKARRRIKKRKLIALIVLVLIISLVVMLHPLDMDGLFNKQGPEFIDMERSTAFSDIFELTYVRIYINDQNACGEVTANGEPLSFNSELGRWELVTSGIKAGDKVKVIVTSEEDKNISQEKTFTVEEL